MVAGGGGESSFKRLQYSANLPLNSAVQ